MKAVNYSKQREAILNFLCSREDHPSADTIYNAVREELPNISKGTVYRNLSLLEDLGRIKRLPQADGCDHYDGRTAPHQHFICSKCGAIEDIFLKNTRSLDKQARESVDGEITGCDIYFYGTCSRCLNK